MTKIDADKDDLATQQMLAMMQDKIAEDDGAHDETLAADQSVIASVAEHDSDSFEHAFQTNPDSDSIDSLSSDEARESSSESSSEGGLEPEPNEPDDLADCITAEESSHLDSLLEEEPTHGLTEDYSALDALIEEQPLASSAFKNTKMDLSALAHQATEAVAAMSEAIALDRQTQELINQLNSSAQMTSKIALTTAQAAQNSTEQAHLAIEKTLNAIAHAKKMTENSHYQIDVQQMKKVGSDALNPILQEIRANNERLQQTNQALAQKTAALFQS
ncbi:MAG: hypothetical protein JXR44_04960 [Thiotrichales bacterium]|nr:hypothetical protein [Thiotrichales bacterium]